MRRLPERPGLPTGSDVPALLQSLSADPGDNVHSSLSADPRRVPDRLPPPGSRDAFYILLPMLIILSTFLFLLLLFLVCVILLRRRRGIMLRDNDGPVDMSREDLIEGEGGFEGVESRWLESVNEHARRAYLRAKGNVLHPPFRHRCSFAWQNTSCNIPPTRSLRT